MHRRNPQAQYPYESNTTLIKENEKMSWNTKITGFADEIAPDLKTQVESFHRLGISHIEMRGVDGNNLIYHNDVKVREIKNYLDGNGITLSALGSPLGKIGITDDFAPHFQDFQRAVEIAHMMDTPYIRMFSFYLPAGSTPEEYEGPVFDRISKLVEYAGSQEVVLLHENEKGIYGEKAAECKKLMNEFYGTSFRCIFDFANYIQAGEDTLEAYHLLKPYISYIHVKDALKENGKVVPAGMGDGMLPEILSDLHQSGYQGFLSLEPHLFQFTGLSELEKTEHKSLVDAKPLSGFEAFSLAHSSLMHILNEL